MARRRDRAASPRRGRGKARGAARRGEGPSAGVPEGLPELSSLSDVPAFSELAPSAAQREAFERSASEAVGAGRARPGELCLGCVVRLDRGFPAVVCDGGLFRAEYQARLGKAENGAAVGDWVAVRMPQGHDRPVLEEVLPRRSDIARWRGGARGERQTLAANVDVVLVAQALSERSLSCARIVRSAVVSLDCGADVAVVLTKADRCRDAAQLGADVARLREVLGPDVPIVATMAAAQGREGGAEGEAALGEAARAAGAGWGLADLRALVGERRVAIVLGESGAGKSTLLNALLGRDVLATGAVRDADDMGRHTTVARRMVSLPGHGVIVDEPGLRSLPLVGHERGLAKLFPDIAGAALGCRFRDCTHTAEPGCAVLAELERGAFPASRLDAYRAIAAEMRESAEGLDPDVVI